MEDNALIPSVSSLHAFCLPLPSVRCQFFCAALEIKSEKRKNHYISSQVPTQKVGADDDHICFQKS